MFWDQMYKLSIWAVSILIILVAGVVMLNMICSNLELPPCVVEAVRLIVDILDLRNI